MLTYDLSKRAEQPLYEYLYKSIKADIITGTLQAGERMPSKRKLAQHLGVSLVTIEGAYSQLIAEGYIRSAERRGYFVNKVIAPHEVVEQSQDKKPARTGQHHSPEATSQGRKGASFLSESKDEGDVESASSSFIDLTGSVPPRGLFPYNRWSLHLRKVLTEADERMLVAESGPFGSLVLRQAIANFLFGYRGMAVDPDSIVIGAGSQVLYQLIVQLLGRDVRYALENPGYGRLARIYHANDVSIAPIPLDEDGIGLDELHASTATVAHIMPTHQYPTGQITSIARRYELLAWAAGGPDRYIIEDDYDCELQFSGCPIPSLQSIDAQQKVIYLNTFTKSLGPSFRMSYMVLPHALVQRFRKQLGFYSCTANAIDQLALARFIDSGEYERHINRVRTRLRSNVTELSQALKRTGRTELTLENAFAGSHCLLYAGGSMSASDFAAKAQDEGIRIRPLDAFSIDRSSMPNPAREQYLNYRLVIDHGALATTEIDHCAKLLASAYSRMSEVG
ncbi:PLP-dependent aminotransferase family protein [Eggerthellaceae bacterium zg-997]|nr:PLP-dependent aminotransferase family protein [Eggerthellaceae bacterium zg-997]